MSLYTDSDSAKRKPLSKIKGIYRLLAHGELAEDTASILRAHNHNVRHGLFLVAWATSIAILLVAIRMLPLWQFLFWILGTGLYAGLYYIAIERHGGLDKFGLWISEKRLDQLNRSRWFNSEIKSIELIMPDDSLLSEDRTCSNRAAIIKTVLIQINQLDRVFPTNRELQYICSSNSRIRRATAMFLLEQRRAFREEKVHQGIGGPDPMYNGELRYIVWYIVYSNQKRGYTSIPIPPTWEEEFWYQLIKESVDYVISEELDDEQNE